MLFIHGLLNLQLRRRKTNTKLMAIMCPFNAHFGTLEYTQEFNIEMWIFREWSWWFSEHCCTQRFYEPKQKKSFDDNQNLNWEWSKEAHNHKRIYSHKYTHIRSEWQRKRATICNVKCNQTKSNQIKSNWIENVNIKTKTVNLRNIR